MCVGRFLLCFLKGSRALTRINTHAQEPETKKELESVAQKIQDSIVAIQNRERTMNSQYTNEVPPLCDVYDCCFASITLVLFPYRFKARLRRSTNIDMNVRVLYAQIYAICAHI